MRIQFGLLAGAGLLAIACAVASAGPADRLDAYLSGLDSVSSRFEQRLFDEQRNLLEHARGTLLIDRPGRFRFEYTEPPQLIVSDGARIWIYDPELAQATVRDLGDALDSTPAALLTTERPVAEVFRVEAVDLGGGFDWFALAPKAEDAAFSSIRLAFAGGELRRMEFVDQFGQVSLIELDAIRHNPTIPAGAFEFTPPTGVDIIEADR